MKDKSENHNVNLDNIMIKTPLEKVFISKNKPKNNNKKKKKRKKGKSKIIKILLLTILFILIFAIVFIIITYKVGFGNHFSLKYGNGKISQDGIYITDVSNLVNKQIPSLVAISCKTNTSALEYDSNYFENSSYSESSGTGIIIGKTEQELLLLTNYHVVENTEEVRAQFIDGNDYIVNIKGYNKEKDIAILTIDLGSLHIKTIHNIKVATIGNSNRLKVGQGVVVIGNSLGYGLSVSTGIISALNRKTIVDNYEISMIQTDAVINIGNSGGALLNSNGELVGIVSFKYSSDLSASSKNVEGIGFAIPISDVSDMIEKLSKRKLTIN